MNPVILADLDDTIFTTMKGYRDADPAVLTRVTTAKNGNHSYMCPARQSIYNWLRNGALFVPVTARSLDAYSRVSLDFGPSGAVLSNGAMVLNPDGSEDLDWKAQVTVLCQQAETTLEEAAAIAEAGICDVRIHMHRNDGVLLGMTIKSNVETEEGVILNLGMAEQLVRKLVTARGIKMHRNGNNLAFVPNGISKKAAVQWLLATRDDLANRPLIGAGDSLSDLPFMELCDMIIIPKQTQTWEATYKGAR